MYAWFHVSSGGPKPLSWGRWALGFVSIMSAAIAKLGFYFSVVVVAFLARRPKLPIVILGVTVPSVALAEHIYQGQLPDWVWITAIIAGSLCMAAVTLAVLTSRAGGDDFGVIPSGVEVRYSASDKDALLGTIAALAVGVALSVGVFFRPPTDLMVPSRVIAVMAAAVFASGIGAFSRLYRNREIVLRVSSEGLGIRQTVTSDERLVPWSQVAGFRFRFGVFTILLENGAVLTRVDSIIDGFYALLYHVNRNTFRRETS